MAELLALDDVRAGYGEAVVLNGISLRLNKGESLALLGRNGVGKTTLINTIVGATRLFSGTLRLNGADITRASSEKRAAAGVGWVPQERNIFRSLTVEENLTAVARPGEWDLERSYAMFPRLFERRRNMGNQLSGGEQQMLAIARALMLNPSLLLLDEPTEGLAPIIVEDMMAKIKDIVKSGTLSAIIVEQHAHKILGLTDRAVILERGAVVHEGLSRDLAADQALLEARLGVAKKG